MKYAIELTNKQKAQMDLLSIVAHKQFGFSPKLEPIENSWESELEKHRKQAYDTGYNSAINDYNAMYEWLHDCFVDFEKFLLEKGFYTDEKFSDGFVVGQLMYDLICDHDIAEVIAEFKKWQEEKKKAKEEIKVGDIIYSQMTESKAIIISFNAWNNWNCIDTCGTGFVVDKSKMESWKKIGHMDNVEEILDKLRGKE